MPALKEKELTLNLTMVYGKMVKLFKINIVFNSEALLWKGLVRKIKNIYNRKCENWQGGSPAERAVEKNSH